MDKKGHRVTMRELLYKSQKNNKAIVTKKHFELEELEQ
jgi:hypothetical protein